MRTRHDLGLEKGNINQDQNDLATITIARNQPVNTEQPKFVVSNNFLQALINVTEEDRNRELKVISLKPTARFKKKGELGPPIRHYDLGLAGPIIAVVVGTLATQSLINASMFGAQFLPFPNKIGSVDIRFLKNPYLAVACSVGNNALVNSFYYYPRIKSSPDYPHSIESLDLLLKTDYSWKRFFLKTADDFFVFLISASGSLIFSLVDIQTSNKFVLLYIFAVVVLWCYSNLHFQGGMDIRKIDIPWLWEKSFAAALYRKIFYHPLEKEMFTLLKQAKKYQAAYIKQFNTAMSAILYHLQQNNTLELQPIFNLLNAQQKDNNTTLNLLLEIFKLIPTIKTSPNKVKSCSEIVKEYTLAGLSKLTSNTTIATSTILMLLAIHGYFLTGDQANEALFNLDPKTSLHWAIAGGTFITFAKFCVTGAVGTGENLYNVLSSSAKKMYNYCANKKPVEAFPLSIAYYRHPSLMAPALITAGSTIFSASTALALNAKTFPIYYPKEIADALLEDTAWPVVAGTVLFNASPDGPIFAAAGDAYDTLFGTEKNKQAIALIEFLLNQRAVWTKMDPINFLEVLQGFSQLEKVISQQENVEETELFDALKNIIFAGQTPQTILENENSSYADNAAAITDLLKQYNIAKEKFEAYVTGRWDAYHTETNKHERSIKELKESGFFSVNSAKRKHFLHVVEKPVDDKNKISNDRQEISKETSNTTAPKFEPVYEHVPIVGFTRY